MFARVNGHNLHYDLSGPAGAPVVLLSHSLASSMEMWDAQRPVLEERFQLLRYDTRGHGQSEATTGPYTLDMLGNDIIGLLDQLDIEKIHWVGISMGGMIGQNLALSHSDRLHSLALCDTAAKTPAESKPVWDERIALACNKGMTSLAEMTLERWFTDAYRRKAPVPYRSIRRQILETDVTGFAGCAQAIKELNHLDELERIDIPTVIVVGDDDLSTPLPNSEAMHQRIGGSTLHIIENARHLSNVEQPVEFNKILIEFLLDHSNAAVA